MLRKIEVSGFKSIKKQSIELGRVNVFIGQNGAGKSNILESVGMISAALSGSISYPLLAAKGIRSSAPEIYRSALKGRRPIYFQLEAEFDELKYSCRVFSKKSKDTGHWSFHSESFCRRSEQGDYVTFAGRSARGVKVDSISVPKDSHSSDSGLIYLIDLLGKLSEKEHSDIDAMSGYAIYSPFTNVLRGVSPDSSNVRPLGLFGGNLVGALADTLKNKENKPYVREIFKLIPWMSGFSYGKSGGDISDKSAIPSELTLSFYDRNMLASFNKLYASDVSEGALYVIFILTLILHPDSPKIFALDNVDSSLNPGLVRGMVDAIGRLAEFKDKQVLLTTHNPTALDGIDLFNDEHRLFVVERSSETGETEVNRLQPAEGTTRDDWVNQTGGARLSELWLNGYLGGFASLDGF